jgi:hypothetical protein
MRNCKKHLLDKRLVLACGHVEEGPSGDKLHFGVSGIETWRVTKSLPRGSRNAEVGNGKINARFYEFNPTMQVKLHKIAGLLLHF